eukprot:833059_1
MFNRRGVVLENCPTVYRNQTGAADRHHRHSRRPEAHHSFHSSRDRWRYGGHRHPIDRYTVETTDGEHVSTPTGSSFEITGLTNGQLLECHLKAHNAMGDSTVAVISGTPGTKPGQPTDIIVTPGDQKLTIHFTRLATDGGHPIDRYTVETTDGEHVSTPTGSSFEITGLTNGQLLECHLKAHNA